ncbi:MAG: hypothetical protein ACXV5I_00800 [Halobacteriota archaeon]
MALNLFDIYSCDCLGSCTIYLLAVRPVTTICHFATFAMAGAIGGVTPLH